MSNQDILYRDDKIRAAQAAKNITDDKLAELSGVGRTSISFITNGKSKDPKLSTLAKIAEALELPLSELFTKKEAA